MKNVKFSLAASISCLVLLGYTYFSFMGMVYWQNGDFVKPLILSISFIILVIICLIVMCFSKHTRWRKIGTIGQSIFGFIIFIAFMLTAIPFTNFVDVIKSKSHFYEETSKVLESAKGLDGSYMEYANTRLAQYQQKLELASQGREINPSEYEELLSQAGGSTDEAKIANLVGSLKRKLIPDSIKNVQAKRLDWLTSAANMSVWNLKLPSNILKIKGEVGTWTEQYVKLSEVKYPGEEVEDFKYEVFSTNLNALSTDYTKLHRPSVFAIIISLLCFLVMLLPYWLMEKDLAGATSNKRSGWIFSGKKRQENKYE